MKNTPIEWTDHTHNHWRGCTKVSDGCAHCYAEKGARRNPKVLGQWGPGKPRVLASLATRREPLRWNREAAEAIEEALHDFGSEEYVAPPRPRVFSASYSDWLDPEVPAEWLAGLLDLIHQTPNLDWQLLTKRPENWRGRIAAALHWKQVNEDLATIEDAWLVDWLRGNPPRHVWIGATVENQAMADRRIPHLLQIPAAIRFLSCEPLLGPVDLGDWIYLCPECDGNGCASRKDCVNGYVNQGIDWVIAGGESGGPLSRPMHPDWPRSLRDQCADAGVPFFFKQWGDLAPASPDTADTSREERFLDPYGNNLTGIPIDQLPSDSVLMDRLGKKAAGHLLDGHLHRQFPTSASQD